MFTIIECKDKLRELMGGKLLKSTDNLKPAQSTFAGLDFYPDENILSSEEMSKSHYHELYEICYLISGGRSYIIVSKCLLGEAVAFVEDKHSLAHL